MFDRIRLRPKGRPLLLFIAACTVLVLTAPAARAGGIAVTTTDDELNSDGDCSLREAIAAANSDTAVDACPPGSGADTIVVPSGVYKLTLAGGSEDDALTGDLDIRDDLTIAGAGKSETIIDGNGLDRVFQVYVPSTGHVYMDGVAITGGYSFSGSGGIYVNGGSLMLLNSRVAENQHGGLAVVAGASLNIASSEVSDNHGSNFGGGIDVFDGSLSMMESAVHGNSAAGGGGIRVGEDATAVIYNSTISNNIAESSYSGGGLMSSGPLTIVNSTISGNISRRYAGGLLVGSGATTSLFNVTIVDNIADSDGDNLGDGGGIHIASGAVNLQNTIVARNADNSSASVYPDCSGTLVSHGHNLIQNLSGCTIAGDKTGNKTGAPPELLPLSDNGGPTLTHALLSRSPAIDAGDPDGCLDEKGHPLAVDQRGYKRPVNGNTAPDIACDIGAFEHLSPGPSPPPASPTPTATATEGPSPTPTTTETPGPSPTPTSTATQGPSPTPTSTVTPGPSPTPTITVTPGPSPTPTATTERPQGAQHPLYLPLFVSDGVRQ